MKNYRKKIIEELKINIKKNSNIFDIWLYGSFKDGFSDIDIIIVYKKNPPKLKFTKIIKNKIFDGSIIYIPKTLRYNIFLFENLKIFSIREKKYIKDKLVKNLREFRELTSFLERYYQRREKMKLIKKENIGNKVRFLKSIILSYVTFYRYCRHKRIKIKKIDILKKYHHLRKKILEKKNDRILNKFINELKLFDRKFCQNSIKILNQNFMEKKLDFQYKFNSYTYFNYNYKKKNSIPFILGEIYNFYSLQKNNLSKKIRKDFSPKEKFFSLDINFQKYLKKKIEFLNRSYVDLHKIGHRNGMYRMTWYLKN